jgi:hypothetical protein
MTVIELIELLEKYPHHSNVFADNAEAGRVFELEAVESDFDPYGSTEVFLIIH